MKQAIRILYSLAFSILFSQLSYGQSAMTLTPYKTNNNRLNEILDTIMVEASATDIIHITADRIGENEDYIIEISFQDPFFLRYDSSITGYTIINNTTILFHCFKAMELLEEDNGLTIRKLFCRPKMPENPTPEEIAKSLLGNDCGLEWTFLIRGNCIKMLRGVKNGEIYWDMEGLRDLYYGNGQDKAK